MIRKQTTEPVEDVRDDESVKGFELRASSSSSCNLIQFISAMNDVIPSFASTNSQESQIFSASSNRKVLIKKFFIPS